MSKILKSVVSFDGARRYRELELEAERAAATVPALYRESFKRVARKWRQLAEEAERAGGFSSRCRRSSAREVVLEY